MPGSIVASFVVLLIPLTLLQRCGAADSITTYELLSKNCSSSGNLSSGGAIVFEMNLRQFLATLPSNVINNRGFFSGSVGSTNAVFRMAMCQADMPWPDHCESCLQAATAEAPKACPSSYNASVAYRGCVLGYWDTPDGYDHIFNGIAFYTQDHAVQVADTTTFDQARTDLFKDLSGEAVTSPLMIASGNLTFNSTHNLYGLAQCNRDVPKKLCSYYIWAVIDIFIHNKDWPSDAQSSEGVSLTGYFYYIRYDLTPFQVYVPDNSSGPTETAKDLVQYKDCPSSGNISTSSDDPYQSNLLQFLEALPSNAISNRGFFNGTTGSKNKVFGTAMCQADIAWPDQCNKCLQAASAGAPKACPASNSASVAYQGCVLRYSDLPILAAADDEASNGVAFYTQNHAASVPDTTAFQQTRQDLLTDLARAALISPMMIGSGSREFNSTHKLHGLAQCNKDLPKELCSGYIQSVTQQLAPNVQWSEGVSFTGFNLYVRYDLTPFAVYVPTTVEGQPTAAKGQPTTVEGQPPTGGFVQRVAIPVSVTIIVLLLIFIVIRHYENKQRKNLELAGLQYISYGEIKSATNNFDEEHRIGEGGFGKVYKGKFKIHQNVLSKTKIDQNIPKELAIKCVRDPAVAKELKAELKILAKLEHRNVVPLIGFCNNDGWFRRHGRGLYVCSELISNGPLDKKIFGQSVIEWPVRYEIIRGVCAGLQYLHQDRSSTSQIVHMDLKPSNILLDEEMQPKIADFGLSRAFLNTRTHTYTTKVTCSFGYTAPEFINNGRASRQCDIYSLGILILAIVMGRGPPSISQDPTGSEFIKNIRDKFDSTTTPNRCTARNREDLKRDANLQDDGCIKDVEKCVGLAFECVEIEPRKRPEAADLYTRLSPNMSVSLNQPNQPAIQQCFSLTKNQQNQPNQSSSSETKRLLITESTTD